MGNLAASAFGIMSDKLNLTWNKDAAAVGF
jgi:hypothetical protein